MTDLPSDEQQRLQREVTDAYTSHTPVSRSTYERAVGSLVRGTTGNLRYFAPYPLYFAGGDGAYLTDVDGHRYGDYFLCNGPMLLGHRHADVEASIEDHRSTGSLVVNPVLAIEVA